MVSAYRVLTCVVLSSVLVACGTPEGNARFGSVPPQDAVEIGRLIRAQTSDRILSYSWNSLGGVEVRTTDTTHVYMARRVRGKWQIALVGLDAPISNEQ
jgi:hypothetical protein